MKKKRKLGRNLLSFVLTLAMLVGLMPGMNLTVEAATTYSSCEVDISNLQVGDILKSGVNLTNNNNKEIQLQYNRYKINGEKWSTQLRIDNGCFPLTIGENGLILVQLS